MTDTRTAATTVPGWVNGAVVMGTVCTILWWVTPYAPFGAAASVLFLTAGIGGIAAVVKPPRQQPLPASPTSLVGVQILHSGGISTVTADLDHPMPRRTVDAVDGHGRPHQLCVGVDASGRVVEACHPGAEWAAAEAI